MVGDACGGDLRKSSLGRWCLNSVQHITQPNETKPQSSRWHEASIFGAHVIHSYYVHHSHCVGFPLGGGGRVGLWH